MRRWLAHSRSAGSERQMPSSRRASPRWRQCPRRIGGLTMQQLADRTLAHARSGLSKATDLEEDAARRLLMTGMNPGGVDRSVMWTNLDDQRGEWQRLFDWALVPPDYRPGLSGEENDHRTRIQTAAREAVAESLFSGGRRDLESLKLGCVTTDRLSYPAPTAVHQEAADSCIRMLGKRRRIDTHRATGDDNQLPKYARDYLEEVANANSITPADFVQDVTALLTRAGVFNQGILLFRGLFVADPGRSVFPMRPVFASSSPPQRRHLQRMSHAARFTARHRRGRCGPGNRLLPLARGRCWPDLPAELR